jgi:hypothetical protein
VQEQGAYTGHNPVGNAPVGSSLPTALQEEDLMPGQHGFGADGTKATWFYKADEGDDQMDENDEHVVPPGIVSKSQKALEFRADL